MACRRPAYVYRFLLQRPAASTNASAASRFRLGFQNYEYGRCKRISTWSPFSSKLEQLQSKPVLSVLKRCISQSAARSSIIDNKISIGPENRETKKDTDRTTIVYQGPISSTIKNVKLLSLSTCCLSVSLGPVITFMTAPEMNVILKGAVASTVIFLSASTTGALHWFVSPYIHKLRWQPGSQDFEAEMMSWLATPITRKLKFSDVKLPDTNRPFVTFKANDNFYFVDAEHCQDKELLAKLTPEKPAHHESAFKNL